MKSNPSGPTTAYFSVHGRCPTVYHGQIVSTAICPTWCTYLYQEREKNRPPLENIQDRPWIKRSFFGSLSVHSKGHFFDTRICHFNIKFRQSYICYWWSYLKFHGDPILSDHWLIIFCYVYFLHLLRDEMINPMKQIIQCKKSRKNKRKWKNFTFIAKWFVENIYTFILFHSQLGTSLWKFLTIVHNILTLWS